MRYPIYKKWAYAGMWCADTFLRIFIPKTKTPIPPPKKLLLCNTAHLGDVILTTALLEPLRVTYPGIKIGMLVQPCTRQVIIDHPLIDYVHTTTKEIKQIGYDTAVDCVFHYPNAAPKLFASKIPTRIGFHSAGLSPLLTHIYPWDATADKSAIEAYTSLLPQLNGTPFPRLATPPTNDKEDYCIIHIGTRNPIKAWPHHKWRSLTKKLLDRGEMLIFTGAGAKEAEAIAQITRGLMVQNLCDKLSWREFEGVIQKAKLLFGVDSCAGHVASAVHTPAILLFTGIHPPKLWRPPGEHIHILTHKTPCSPCYRGCQTPACITEISVEQLLQHYDQLQNESNESNELISI